MNYSLLKLFTVLLPTAIIGGFEYIRHGYLQGELSMEAGNFYMTLLTLALSYLFATWMFRRIERTNVRLAQEEAKRAVYEERERLARELHDSIAQTIFFLNVKLQKGQIEEAKSAVAAINGHLRQAIFNLRSSPDEPGGLHARIGAWLDEWSLLSGVDAKRELTAADARFQPEDQVRLFAIVQEAFTNIRKHAKAEQAEIALREDGDGWLLRIADNGCGFRQQDEGRQNLYGLLLMKKRAEELGAQFRIGPAMPCGTEITVRKGGNRR